MLSARQQDGEKTAQTHAINVSIFTITSSFSSLPCSISLSAKTFVVNGAVLTLAGAA